MSYIGRKSEIERIIRYAKTDDLDNRAFFGVPGLGKTKLMENVFSKQNCRLFADEYQRLFVRAILQPEKKGDELINFLYDRAINAIDLIGDEAIRDSILERINAYADKFHSKDSMLRYALEEIMDNEYSFILVMDDFQNMGRNSSVGTDQYDFMRSLNEMGLIYYWVISDSDFSDVYATQQFTTSFFVQKFSPETISQMKNPDMIQLLTETAAKKGIDLSESIKGIILDTIGGIPGFVQPMIQCIESSDIPSDENAAKSALINLMLDNPRCLSMLRSWSRSLKIEQKDILMNISQQTKVYQNDILSIILSINELGDNCGLGLLVHGSDEKGKYWRVNSDLYKEYILSKTDDFYSADIISPEIKPEIRVEGAQPAPTTYIQNAYFTVNNNFFDPDQAVKSLLILKEIAASKQLPAPNKTLTDAIQCLPYEQSGWEKLTEEQKDEQMDTYADNIFASGEFRTDKLSETQLSRFSLTQSFVDQLSDYSRDNLISAIQVYDLLQFCIDRFGLNMLNSESPRAILFARLYESMLKETLYPAFCSVSEISSLFLPKLGCTVANAPEHIRTIKYFANVLYNKETKKRFSDICTTDIGRKSNDFRWWTSHQDDMFHIGDLRNECCHSGNVFTRQKLESLIHYLFDLHAITNIEVYNDIVNRH